MSLSINQEKKNYIIEFLDKIAPYREDVNSLKERIVSNDTDDSYIDKLYEICKNIVQKTSSENGKENLQLIAQKMKNLYEQEKLSKEQDMRDLAILETMLEKI